MAAMKLAYIGNDAFSIHRSMVESKNEPAAGKKVAATMVIY